MTTTLDRQPHAQQTGTLPRLTATLRTPRLTLRPLMIEDAPRVAMFVGDFEVSKMLAKAPHPTSEAHARAFIAGGAVGQALAVVHANGVIGVVGLHDNGNGGADFGYWLGKPFWGRGFATEAGRAVIAEARRQCGDNAVITAQRFSDNPASGRVLIKLGFVATGESEGMSLARGHAAPNVQYRLLPRSDTPDPQEGHHVS